MTSNLNTKAEHTLGCILTTARTTDVNPTEQIRPAASSNQRTLNPQGDYWRYVVEHTRPACRMLCSQNYVYITRDGSGLLKRHPPIAVHCGCWHAYTVWRSARRLSAHACSHPCEGVKLRNSWTRDFSGAVG
jgi:hypothetical protein